MAYYNFPNYNPNGFTSSPNLNNTNVYAFVNGVEGAKSFIINPNSTVLLMDNENPICYMKQSNSIGQSSLRYFKLLEINEQQAREETTPKQPKIMSNEYVSKSDFDKLMSKVDALCTKLEPTKEEKTNG